MKLHLVPVPALSSREELFFHPERRRRGTMASGAEFEQVRVPRCPPPSEEHRAFAALRAELGLDNRAAAAALWIRVPELLALERGELRPADAADWTRAMQALRDAATHRAPG